MLIWDLSNCYWWRSERQIHTSLCSGFPVRCDGTQRSQLPVFSCADVRNSGQRLLHGCRLYTLRQICPLWFWVVQNKMNWKRLNFFKKDHFWFSSLPEHSARHSAELLLKKNTKGWKFSREMCWWRWDFSSLLLLLLWQTFEILQMVFDLFSAYLNVRLCTLVLDWNWGA